jgi:hypothetical protein
MAASRQKGTLYSDPVALPLVVVADVVAPHNFRRLAFAISRTIPFLKYEPLRICEGQLNVCRVAHEIESAGSKVNWHNVSKLSGARFQEAQWISPELEIVAKQPLPPWPFCGFGGNHTVQSGVGLILMASIGGRFAS